MADVDSERAERVADLAVMFLGMGADERRAVALEALAIADRLAAQRAQAAQSATPAATNRASAAAEPRHVHGVAASRERAPLTAEIVAELSRSSGALTVGGLARALFGKEDRRAKDKVNKALYNLVRARRVKRVGNGRYASAGV